MINFTGRLRAVKWDEYTPYGGAEIKTKSEIKKNYDEKIRLMRANRDATLAMWDYMHSVGVQKKIAALNGDVTMYFFPPEELDRVPAYIDCFDSDVTDTAEIYSDDLEESKKGIDEILELAAEAEREASEKRSDFEDPLHGPEDSEAY